MELVETLKAFLRGENPTPNVNATTKMSPYNKTATIDRKSPKLKRARPAVSFIAIGVVGLVILGAGYFFGGDMLLSLLQTSATATLPSQVCGYSPNQRHSNP